MEVYKVNEMYLTFNPLPYFQNNLWQFLVINFGLVFIMQRIPLLLLSKCHVWIVLSKYVVYFEIKHALFQRVTILNKYLYLSQKPRQNVLSENMM
jgi:hypothetical protein